MSQSTWPRIIVHVDMDAFFAQVEQRDNPELRGKPIVITNGRLGRGIITCSYEARAYGIKTGLRLPQARLLCPEVVHCSSRPGVYAAVSAEIMSVLQGVSPDMEIFSVDEAFLDLSHCRDLYRSAKTVAQTIKHRIFDATGLTCSVGVSGDKTTAKIASKRNKPNGIAIIPPWRSRETLAPLKVTELCGISTGVAHFLAQYGVYYCWQMADLPIDVMARRFGQLGRRLWMMCLGQDPSPVQEKSAMPRSVGHGKVMPPNTQCREIVLSFLGHMAEKVAKRLRAHQLTAQRFYVGLKLQDGWLAEHYKTVQPTQDGLLIYQLAKALVEQHWQGEGVFQCQVTAHHLTMGHGQQDLFEIPAFEQASLNAVIDQVNHRYGDGGLVRAHYLEQLAMPDVIAPAWRPTGVRASIQATPDIKSD